MTMFKIIYANVQVCLSIVLYRFKGLFTRVSLRIILVYDNFIGICQLIAEICECGDVSATMSKHPSSQVIKVVNSFVTVLHYQILKGSLL